MLRRTGARSGRALGQSRAMEHKGTRTSAKSPPSTPSDALEEALVQLGSALSSRGSAGFKQQLSARPVALELPPASEQPGRFSVLCGYEAAKVLASSLRKAPSSCAIAVAADDASVEQSALDVANDILSTSSAQCAVRVSSLSSIELVEREAFVAIVLDPARLPSSVELASTMSHRAVLVNSTSEALTVEQEEQLDVLYSLTPLAIQTLFGLKYGAVYKPSPSSEWLIYSSRKSESGDDYELAGRAPSDSRPSQTDIEQSLYSNQAARSPINQGLAWALSKIRGKG